MTKNARFDPCGIGIFLQYSKYLHIDLNNGSSCDAVFGVNIVAPNVTVWCAVHQPVIMPIILNDLLHDAIRMNECSADHR